MARYLASLFLGALLFAIWSALPGDGQPQAWARAEAARFVEHERERERLVELSVGGSQTVRVPQGLEKIVVGDPQVCEVISMNIGQILLIGKGPGETQVTVWTRDGYVNTLRVVARLPIAALQQALREVFPNENDLQVRTSGSAIYLTGKVTDAVTADAMARLAANLYVGAGRKAGEVVNLLSVVAPQQVQVHMRFVEITRSNARNLGFNAWLNNDSYAGALLGNGDPAHFCLTCDTQRFVGPANPLNVNPAQQGPGNPWLPIITAPITGSFALSFATVKGFMPLSATLALLESHGVAKTLSEPTLVATSGQQAKFLVGGEFPIPIPDSLGRITVAFKKYGAQINFTPTVLNQETMHLMIESEVSALDNTNGVNLGTVKVPALSSRQSSTAVRMRDGQSFAIAGLLSDSISNTSDKVPLLGEIPVLGMFFRNVTAKRVETELMVLVTVNLVKPFDANEVPPMLKNEEFNDPSDLELFFLGNVDRTHVAAPRASNSPAANPHTNVLHSRLLTPAATAPEGAVGFSR